MLNILINLSRDYVDLFLKIQICYSTHEYVVPSGFNFLSYILGASLITCLQKYSGHIFVVTALSLPPGKGEEADSVPVNPKPAMSATSKS